MLFSIETLQESNQFDKLEQFIDSHTFLTEEESEYFPEMVPVAESKQLGKYIISLEDLCDYASANNITDAGYAVSTVLESVNLGLDDIIFSIKENHAYSDTDYQDIVASFIQEGATVYLISQH